MGGAPFSLLVSDRYIVRITIPPKLLIMVYDSIGISTK